MNLQRLTRKLRREVTANPKKAAILGLLVLVALYFWAPLVWDWVASGDSASAPAAAKSPSPKRAAAPLSGLAPPGRRAAANPAKAGTNNTPPSWEQLARWIDQDPRMRPVREIPLSRDPLHPVEEKVVQQAEPEATEAAKEAKAATPESLGLVLSSTLIGARRRTALVGGRPYEMGQTIEVTKDGQQYEFTLAEVHPRRIVLTRQGREYELAIPRPPAAGRLELYGSTH